MDFVFQENFHRTSSQGNFYISEAGLVAIGESFFLSLLTDNPTFKDMQNRTVNTSNRNCHFYCLKY